MAKRPLPTPTVLRQLLRYEPETGKLYWLERPDAPAWNRAHAGGEALTFKMSNGYLSGTVLARTVWAHRVAWAVHYGAWPEHQIDHINGDKTDNRIANLRDVTDAENKRNSPRYRNNTSGVSGVRWHEGRKQWRAFLAKRQIGSFADYESAVAARLRAERENGYHEHHGR